MRTLGVLALTLLVGACSTVRLAYDNADTYLKWKLGGYLDLHGEASGELDQRVVDFMAWHRAHALPRYAEIADDGGRRLSRGLSREDLVWGYDSAMAQARESLRAAAERIAPVADRLTAEQIGHLEQRFGEDNRTFAKENLRGSERERRARRAERNVERLEDWVGKLSQAQVDRVTQYSERAPMLEEHRARDHQRLQSGLLAIVRAREARKRLADYAVSWDRGRDPAYAAALEAARGEYYAMVLDIDRSLSAAQRARALEHLRRYAADFRALAARARTDR